MTYVLPRCARCGHWEMNHTRSTFVYRGINICLERSGFLGWRRCPCIEFEPVRENAEPTPAERLVATVTERGDEYVRNEIRKRRTSPGKETT